METDTSVLLAQDEEKPVLPLYGVVILVTGLLIITAVVIFLILRAYKRKSIRMAKADVKSQNVLELMQTRERLLSTPSGI